MTQPSAPAPRPPGGIRYYFRNTISMMGLSSVLFWGVVLLYFVYCDLTSTANETNAYSGLLVYVLFPVLFWSSVAMVLFGAALKRRRFRKSGGQVPDSAALPRPNAMILFLAVPATLAWLGLSSLGCYKVHHYASTNTFCGMACHQVMSPEYKTYHDSSHASVACVKCHVGPDAGSVVKAKTNGVKQLWQTLTHDYQTPIKTPLAHASPTRATCEQCHSTRHFKGSVERVVTHYATDADNTPTRYKLLFHVASEYPPTGRVGRLHWHASDRWTVKFFAADEQLQNIPYVRVIPADGGAVEEFVAAGFDKSTLEESKLRTMDCTDCHNRIGHDFKTPSRALDEAFDTGRISLQIPMFKRTALKALQKPYKSTPDALNAIGAEIDKYYADNPLPSGRAALLPQAREAVLQIYRENFFPEQGVDYRAFVNNNGHYEFKGCERCHDWKHRSSSGKVIGNKCDSCHLILGQATGAENVAKMQYGLAEFEHPEEQVSLKKTCSSCHALKKD